MEHLLKDIEVAPPEEHLQRASDSVDDATLESVGLDRARLERMRELTYHDFWLETLQKLGRILEDRGNPWPTSTWHELACAAKAMGATRFMPFLIGKSEGQAPSDAFGMYDAFMTLHRRNDLPQASSLLDPFVKGFGALHPEYAAAIAQAEPVGVLLRRDADAGEVDSSALEEVNGLWMEEFDEIFAMVTDPGFPQDLRAEAWAIIDFNYFSFRLSEIPFLRQTHQVPWWLNLEPPAR